MTNNDKFKNRNYHIMQSGSLYFDLRVLHEGMIYNYAFKKPKSWPQSGALDCMRNFAARIEEYGREEVEAFMKDDLSTDRFFRKTGVPESYEAYLRRLEADAAKEKVVIQKQFESVNDFVIHVRNALKLQVSFVQRTGTPNGCIMCINFTDFNGNIQNTYEYIAIGKSFKEAKLQFANTEFKNLFN